MKLCFADLHVHTALSPCADDEMTPPRIVERALAEGLAMIAVCDHNTTGNAAAVQMAAERATVEAAVERADAKAAAGRTAATGTPSGDGLTVIAGMEVTSVEECHVVGLFPDAAAAAAAGAEVTGLLPAAGEGYAEFFGEQHLLAADGTRCGAEPAALATATPLDVGAVVALVHRHGGLAVAAHVDRRSFGVVGQLGVFPAEAGFDAVEVSRHVTAGSPKLAEHAAFGLPLLRSSDSHTLDTLGSARTALRVAAPTFAELALALRGAEGRSVAVA
ncbi:MAG: PHP domain-containing protein [Thermoleophilia bacterium]|nr:PHP domain-containing protein [Thermoleophilia bacterium]